MGEGVGTAQGEEAADDGVRTLRRTGVGGALRGGPHDGGRSRGLRAALPRLRRVPRDRSGYRRRAGFLADRRAAIARGDGGAGGWALAVRPVRRLSRPYRRAAARSRAWTGVGTGGWTRGGCRLGRGVVWMRGGVPCRPALRRLAGIACVDRRAGCAGHASAQEPDSQDRIDADARHPLRPTAPTTRLAAARRARLRTHRARLRGRARQRDWASLSSFRRRMSRCRCVVKAMSAEAFAAAMTRYRAGDYAAPRRGCVGL